MTEEIKTEETTPADQQPFMLSILVDLSHSSFAGRGVGARIALAELLSGLARQALIGADATIVEDGEGVPLAVYMIAPDSPTREGKQAFQMADAAIRKGGTQFATEVHSFSVPAEG